MEFRKEKVKKDGKMDLILKVSIKEVANQEEDNFTLKMAAFMKVI